jgi:hypothetical protein
MITFWRKSLKWLHFFKRKFKMIFMFENGWDLDEKSFDAFVEETI